MQALSIETSRLQIRWLDPDDAGFIHTLVNDPDWIRFIGDKRVRDLEDARNYLETGPLAMYRKHGFGLNRVALKDSDLAIGICGILQRESMPEPDLGFAFLPAHRRQGYALEASQAVLEHGFANFGFRRLAAILSPQNTASANLLAKLGFRFDRHYRAEADAQPLDLYVIDPEKD
jgi:RimJ/RimL family protein N-acetyltransferase